MELMTELTCQTLVKTKWETGTEGRSLKKFSDRSFIMTEITQIIWRNKTWHFSVGVLQTLVIALGAGLGIWGVVNLMEGYGNDNLGANAHVW